MQRLYLWAPYVNISSYALKPRYHRRDVILKSRRTVLLLYPTGLLLLDVPAVCRQWCASCRCLVQRHCVVRLVVPFPSL